MSDSTHEAGSLEGGGDALGAAGGAREPGADAVGAYTGARPEVQALVPRSARRVLDLGCASGALGSGLKARSPVVVVGVELEPAHAREAERRLDRVVVGDVEELLAREDVAERLAGAGDPGAATPAAAAGAPAAAGPRGFDCIVAADVLEHLRDPWTALRQAVELLAPGGAVVVSLPNVRFFETFWELGVRGRWPRRSHGIFDATHLRWFALRDARELLEQAGLRVEDVRPLIRVRPGGSRFDRLFGWLARTPLCGFFAFQYVLVGRVGGVPPGAPAAVHAHPDSR